MSQERKVQIGEQEVTFGGQYLQDIRSSYASEETAVLQQRLEQDGYLCMRGLIPTESVQAARRVAYDQMVADGVMDADSTFDHQRGAGKSYMGQQHVTHHPDYLGMCENPAVFDFFNRLFDEESISFDYKWARAVPQDAAGTNAHMDVVYMGRGSQRLNTCWIPVGDISLENGPMCILPTSHNCSATERIRETYGKLDVDRDGVEGGWFSNNYIELSKLVEHPWVTGDFQAGDVIIMGIYLLHGSVRNQIDKVRFTVDVRFQPKADEIDDRWVGKDPKAHKSWWERQQEGTLRTMEEVRAEWGV